MAEEDGFMVAVSLVMIWLSTFGYSFIGNYQIMKHLVIFSVCVFFLSGKLVAQYTDNQYAVLDKSDPEFGLMVSILNEWCETHFTNCFGWKFVNLDDGSLTVSRLRQGKWKISGRNQNQGVASGGRGSSTYTREFRATVEGLGSGRFSVYMKKQSITVLGESWLECTKIIDL